jgi:hypothetical protein
MVGWRRDFSHLTDVLEKDRLGQFGKTGRQTVIFQIIKFIASLLLESNYVNTPTLGDRVIHIWWERSLLCPWMAKVLSVD